MQMLGREKPSPRNRVLIGDLFEGGDAESMLARVAALKQSGVNVIVLLALSDDGHAAYNTDHAGKIAGIDCPVFACNPGSVSGADGRGPNRAEYC